MKSNYIPIGQLVEKVDERNIDGTVTNLVVVSIDKCFIKSVANTIGTDLKKYKIIKRKDFAVSLMQVSRDEKIPVAMQNDYDIAIMSPAYPIFRVADENIILPEYLDLWFKRTEFDREAAFIAVGGVRGSMPWEEFCRMEVLVPDIEKQRKIVKAYKTITDRIALKQRINDNLEATAQAYFDKLFIDGFECTTTLNEIALINPTRDLAKNQTARCFDMSTLPLKGCVPVGGEYKPYNGGMRFMNGDTILARITPCLENGKAAYINILEENEVAFGSTEYIVLSPKENVPSSFFYFLARNSTFITYAVAHMNGSSGRQRVSGSDIANYPIKEPSKDELQVFDKYASKVLYEMKISALEIEKLKELQDNITATISGS